MNLFRSVADYATLVRRRNRWSRRRLEAYQLEAVRSLLARAVRDSPFYRNLYGGRVPASLEEFRTFPTIDKATMMASFDALNTAGLSLADASAWAMAKERNKDWLGYYRDRYVVGLSSGTSGNRGIYVTPRELTERLPAVFLARGGVPLSLLPFRILFLLRVFSQGFSDISSPLIHLSYLGTMEPAERIVAEADRLRVNVLMAPPSLLRTLLPLVGRLRTRVRLVVTYAEVLEDEEKSRLERAFGCRVVQIYQASEGQMGSPCREGTLHVNEDLVYVELYDAAGRPVTGPGPAAASMVVTNLVNEVQPLIRYRMNDLVELGPPCPCGSSFRTIRRVLGRNDDVLYLMGADGSLRPLFPDLVARWIITEDATVREFRVEQADARTLSVRLDMLPGADGVAAASAVRARVESELAALGLAAVVSVETGPLVLPAEMHKYRRFVRRFPAP